MVAHLAVVLTPSHPITRGPMQFFGTFFVRYRLFEAVGDCVIGRSVACSVTSGEGGELNADVYHVL